MAYEALLTGNHWGGGGKREGGLGQRRDLEKKIMEGKSDRRPFLSSGVCGAVVIVSQGPQHEHLGNIFSFTPCQA